MIAIVRVAVSNLNPFINAKFESKFGMEGKYLDEKKPHGCGAALSADAAVCFGSASR
jgi:hypothetical protein